MIPHPTLVRYAATATAADDDDGDTQHIMLIYTTNYNGTD